MKINGYICFDLETNGLFEDSEKSNQTDQSNRTNCPNANEQVTPLVYCAVTCMIEKVHNGQFSIKERICWAPPLDISPCVCYTQTLTEMVAYMHKHVNHGYAPLGWNSTGFDFKVLWRSMPTEAEKKQVEALAWKSIDPMLNFFMIKGFPVALNSVARAMTPGFCKNGSGKQMSEQWESGTPEQRQAVIKYCERDVDVLATVVSAIEHAKEIRWITKRTGKIARCKPDDSDQLSMLVVTAANLPHPDNSWMSDDRPVLSNFVGWLHPQAFV